MTSRAAAIAQAERDFEDSLFQDRLEQIEDRGYETSPQPDPTLEEQAIQQVQEFGKFVPRLITKLPRRDYDILKMMVNEHAHTLSLLFPETWQAYERYARIFTRNN